MLQKADGVFIVETAPFFVGHFVIVPRACVLLKSLLHLCDVYEANRFCVLLLSLCIVWLGSYESDIWRTITKQQYQTVVCHFSHAQTNQSTKAFSSD